MFLSCKEFFRTTPSLLSQGGLHLLSPSPFPPQEEGDVAGDAIALPEFWYRKRSLCPKGLAMISYAIELRLFVRCKPPCLLFNNTFL